MSTTPVRAWIGLGGNLGDVPATLRRALDALSALPGTRLVAASRFYRTPAWGVTDQPPFVNAAVGIDTVLAPAALLAALLDIERAAGRDRTAPDARRWGPRALDLDLLLYGDRFVDLPGLHVPHPHLHERAFVLVPLAGIAADVVVPGRGRVADLLAGVDATGIQALP